MLDRGALYLGDTLSCVVTGLWQRCLAQFHNAKAKALVTKWRAQKRRGAEEEWLSKRGVARERGLLFTMKPPFEPWNLKQHQEPEKAM